MEHQRGEFENDYFLTGNSIKKTFCPLLQLLSIKGRNREKKRESEKTVHERRKIRVETGTRVKKKKKREEKKRKEKKRKKGKQVRKSNVSVEFQQKSIQFPASSTNWIYIYTAFQ